VDGAVVFALYASATATQLLVARFGTRRVVLAGLATLLVALALVVAGLSAASMALFIAGTIVGGVGVGGAFLGSLATANRLAPAAERGRVLSTYFVFCYIGQAIPVIGVGFASADVGDFRAVLVCAIALAAVSVLSMAGIRRAAPALADDNIYTNLMAQRNLLAAADAAKRYPDRARELGVSDQEPAGWRDAAEAMTIPYDEALGVHAQAAGFTRHQVWDFARTSPQQYPLMLHFPYFDLYRKQVVKQADLVLAMHMHSSAFTPEQKTRDFAYYEALTVRDSSLSACSQAVIAAETGHLNLAYDYLAEAALIDLRDLEHNTRDGLHIASLAGTWIALVNGFGGLRLQDGTVSFAPRLPDGLTRLRFTLFIGGRRLRVEVTHAQARYILTGGDPLEILHHGHPVTLTAGKPHVRRIPTAPSRPRPSQPAGREPVHRPPTGNATKPAGGRGTTVRSA